MNNLAAIVTGGQGALVSGLAMLQCTLEILRPSLDIAVPGYIALLARRWIHNKKLADTVSIGAGVAYNHLSAQYARNGSLDFGNAKAAAVSAGVAAMGHLATLQLDEFTAAKVSAQVDGALGELLAADRTFSVTGAATIPSAVVNTAVASPAVPVQLAPGAV